MATWNADFCDNKDDAKPFRSTTIIADTEDEAVEKARAQMGGAMRVDVTRVDPSPGPDLSKVNMPAVDRFLRNLPGRTDRE